MAWNDGQGGGRAVRGNGTVARDASKLQSVERERRARYGQGRRAGTAVRPAVGQVRSRSTRRSTTPASDRSAAASRPPETVNDPLDPTASEQVRRLDGEHRRAVATVIVAVAELTLPAAFDTRTQ